MSSEEDLKPYVPEWVQILEKMRDDIKSGKIEQRKFITNNIGDKQKARENLIFFKYGLYDLTFPKNDTNILFLQKVLDEMLENKDLVSKNRKHK